MGAAHDLNPIFHHPAVLLLDHRRRHTAAAIKQIHAHLTTTGLALHTYPLSRILPVLPPSSAAALLLRHHRPTTFLYNTLISSLAARRLTSSALSLYSHLLTLHLPPNAHTFPSLLSACAARPRLHPHARALHAHIIKYLAGTPDPFVPAALLAFYSRAGDLPACRRLFDRIPNPDLPAWNSILAAYSAAAAGGGTAAEALLLFNKLQLSPASPRPNEITLVAVINACGDLGVLAQTSWAHAYINRRGLATNRFVGTALVGAYSECGRLDLAVQVFDELPHKDTLCYNTMIRAFAVHGDAPRAVRLFSRMRSEGVAVDDVTVLVVMTACAHAGMVEDGRLCFDSMRAEFGIEPKQEHYGCLVDILGRAGRLAEAEAVVGRMPIEPNAVVYRSLLGACRIHRDVEMGERMIACLMRLEPEHGGNYVLMSNMYADISKWDEVRRVRKAMKDMGINKNPGSSSIEMDGIMHEFITGDKEHPCWEEIYAMLHVIDRNKQSFGENTSTLIQRNDLYEEQL